MPETPATDDDAALRRWVGSLDEDGLVALLRARPDLAWGAPPADLDDLAERLTHPAHIAAAVEQLDLPSIMLLDLVMMLGWGADLERLTRFVQVPDAPHETAGHVHDILVRLTAVGLVVPRTDDGGVVAVPGLERVVPPSLGGVPLRVLLGVVPVEQMVRALRGHGIQLPTKARAAVATALRTRLSDVENVQEIAASAGHELRQALHVLAVRRVPGPEDAVPAWRQEAAAARWAAEAGLSLSTSTSTTPVFATEVLLALLQGAMTIDLPARRPVVATTEVRPEVLLRASAGALVDAMSVGMGVLEHVARTPLPLRKDGLLGAREVTRLAKTLGGDVRFVRWALETAAARGLLVRAFRLEAGEGFDAWRRTDLGARCADLLQEWLRMGTLVVRDRDLDGGPAAVLGLPTALAVAPTREALLAGLADLPPGRGAASTEDLQRAVAWLRPSFVAVHGDEGLAADVLVEAELLGVVASGSLTPVGAALVAGDRKALVAAAAAALPDTAGTAVFGSDLTVLVVGTPDADVVDLLDAVAEREARGAANSWRLTTASLRAALDAGHDAAELLTRLRGVAGKPLPQPVEYFVTDVGRRYGRFAVRPAGTVLVGDEVLVAELLADSGLRRLELQAVASTVLLSTADTATVLGLVRRAGYLPRAERADGSPATSPIVLQRKPLAALLASLDARATAARLPPAPSTTALALRLLAGAPAPDDAASNTLAETLRPHTKRLTTAERRQLAHAVAHDRPVRLLHRSRSGDEHLLVDHPALIGPTLTGEVAGRPVLIRTDLVLQVAPARP